MNQTLVMVKPDGVQRKMAGPIITAIESHDLNIDSIKKRYLSKQEASSLYAAHRGKWFFDRNIRHVTSGSVILMKISGDDCVKTCRKIVKSIREANKDVIVNPKNILHATDDPDKVLFELESVGMYESKTEHKIAV